MPVQAAAGPVGLAAAVPEVLVIPAEVVQGGRAAGVLVDLEVPVILVETEVVLATPASGEAVLVIPAVLAVLVIPADGEADPDIPVAGEADLATDMVTDGDTVVMDGDVDILATAHMPDRDMATMATRTAALRRDMDGTHVHTITVMTIRSAGNLGTS